MNKNDYLKLGIGSSMSLSEGLIFGNFFESLKIMKQNGVSYRNGFNSLYSRSGLYSLLYTGYFPWGAIQSVGKGLPVFYTSYTIKEYMKKREYNNNQISIVAGFGGGISQGIFVAPLQRMKTLAINNQQLSINGGIREWFRGTTLTCSRRSLDWVLRFYFSDKLNQKIDNPIVSAFIAGSISALTLPIDVLIVRTQSSEKQKLNEIIRNMIKNEGLKSFTNGLTMRIIHAGWHTAWIIGVGDILYRKLKE